MDKRTNFINMMADASLIVFLSAYKLLNLDNSRTPYIVINNT